MSTADRHVVHTFGIGVITLVGAGLVGVLLMDLADKSVPEHPLCPPAGFKIQMSDQGRFRYVTPQGWASPHSSSSRHEAIGGAWRLFDVIHTKAPRELKVPPTWVTIQPCP